MVIEPKNLIVCYKHKQSVGQKTLGVFLPILFWSILLYILSTFFALCSHAIDYSRFANIIDYQDIEAIRSIITRYFPTIGAFVCTFMLWALYNMLRFSGSRNRRTTQPKAVSMQETSEFCHLGTDEISAMHQAKLMTCLFDDKGNIVGVRYNSPVRQMGETSARAKATNSAYTDEAGERLATLN